MLISSPIPNLVNGVSQQPDALRLASQCEEQTNFSSSVIEGLKRRSGYEHVARLSAFAGFSDWDNLFIHTINRDSVERYLMVILSDDLKVFDLVDGTERTVNFPQGKSYLLGAQPSDIRAVTVADYTFILNRGVDTEMFGTATTPERNPQALVHVAGGNYSKTFEVTVDGNVVATYQTPDGSDAAHVANVSTSYIADQLYASLSTSIGATADYQVTQLDNVIHIENVAGNDFSITTSDGFNNAYLKLVTDTVQRFSDLPGHAPAGFRCEVVGEASSSFDNYYVEWVADAGSETSGVWKETVKWGIEYQFTPSRLPHTLTREADGTFTFGRPDWADREVGDEDSAPEPSFIGGPINDIFFFKNRLGFAAGENVIMSRSGGFFNFWPETVTTVLDTDPIDVAVSHEKVSIVNHAVPFNSDLVLFSSQTQFILSGGDILTPSTVSVTATTEFEGSETVRPVAAGSNIYFPVRRGRYSGLREFFVVSDTRQNNATDVTSHVPKYVPSDISLLSSSTNEDMIIALAPSDPSAVYVYKYFYGSEGKLQSSWSRWDFPGDEIIHAAFLESDLYLAIKRPDGLFLGRLDLAAGTTEENSDYLYHVDRKVFEDQLQVTVAKGNTTFTLPYEEEGDLWVFIRDGDPVWPEGRILDFTRPTPDTVVLVGDYSGSKICIGRKFESSYEFSTFLLKEDVAGGGQASISAGRLQIQQLSLDYADTAYFEVHVTPENRETYVYKFSGRDTGSPSALLGALQIQDGRFKLPVMSQNRGVKIVIKTNHFMPCSFMGAEWEGRYTTRARRL